MPADAPTVFEVATIKPSDPNRPGKLFTVRGREVLTINTTLADLITLRTTSTCVRSSADPRGWKRTSTTSPVGPRSKVCPTSFNLRGHIRTLLEDRFKLAIHREKRTLPAYALTVTSGGSKMRKDDANPKGLPGLGFKALGVLGVVNATMADFAATLQGAVLDRPVVDRTGLEGRYDFTLEWTPDESQFRTFGSAPPPSPDAKLPSLFTAIQEQIGLKLESVNAPVEVIVIDRVEKPSEN